MIIFHLLCQHARLVLVLLVVSELYLDLEGSELNCSLQRHRMSPIQNCFLGLLVQKIELDWVAVMKIKFKNNLIFV